MKHFSEIINEDKIKYKLSEDYVSRTTKLLDDFVKNLPEIPNVSHELDFGYPAGKFWFNPDDLLRSALAESTEYIGHPQEIHLKLDTRKEKEFNADTAKEAFKKLSGMRIDEGIFGNNVTNDLPEWSWAQKLYDELSKYFKTKSFNKVNSEYTMRYNNYPAAMYKILKNLPTVEKDGLFITLYAIDFRGFEPNSLYSNIRIVVFVYEKKDPNKVKEINTANNARKPLDIVGRELEEGDLIAYAGIGGYGGYKGMLTGIVVKAAKDLVTLKDGKSVYANRCCLISRKDGKRIE